MVDGVEVMKSSNWKIPKEKMFYIDKEMDEIAEFKVRVRNESTTRMMRIDEKVFSARDWLSVRLVNCCGSPLIVSTMKSLVIL